MGKRRDGREAAIQFLFSRDINKDLGPDDFDTFFSLCIAPAGARKFAKELLTGMLDNLEEIDTKLEPELENFELKRLSTIDRNVLQNEGQTRSSASLAATTNRTRYGWIIQKDPQ